MGEWMLEDMLLAAGLNRGEQDALRRIYQKYKPDLSRIAAALLRDRGDVEDVLHEVFVGLAGQAGRLTVRGSLKAYLAVSVANQARDYNRRRQRHPAAALPDEPLADRRAPRPAGGVEHDELARVLAEAMGRLPDEQREVIVLRLQGGLRFRQIARSQGMSLSTVKGRYRYGLGQLRKLLNGVMEP